jgi:hypothetical protein
MWKIVGFDQIQRFITNGHFNKRSTIQVDRNPGAAFQI